MSITVTISSDLARRLEKRRAESGASLDALVEALIAYALEGDDADDDHSDGFTDEELRAFIAEADASGPAVDWDAKAVRAEILHRSAERIRQS